MLSDQIPASEFFCIWLQGYFELSNSEELDPNQVQIIKDHLQLVFKKVTPDRTNGWEIREPDAFWQGPSTMDPLPEEPTTGDFPVWRPSKTSPREAVYC